jgi:HEAT repeat protein
MSIEAHCPTCEKTYVLPDTQYGKRVRCKHCADVFMVGGVGATPSAGAPPALPTPPPEPEKKKKVEEPSMMPLFMIFGGVLILLIGVGGLLLWMFMGGGGGLPGLTPVSDVNTALAALKEDNTGRRRMALDWFAKNPADADRRDEVAKAVDPFLFDKDQGVRQWSAHALAVWGNKDSVPSLLKHLQQDQGAMNESIRALGFLRDDRALDPIVRNLADGGRRKVCEEALQHFGPGAQKEVLKHLNDANRDVKDSARRLLAEYKTRDELLIAQSIADLKSQERDTRWSAADWLAKHPVVSAKQSQVSKALLPLLKDADGGPRGAALAALLVWGDRNDPQLIGQFVALLGTDHGTWDAAFKALQRFGPAAEKAVVTRLHDPRREVRENVARLLQEYKTKDDLILSQSIKDLGATVKETKMSAAAWLSKQKVVESQQAAASKALVGVVRDLDDKVREASILALTVWGDKDAVPSLIDAYTDDSKRFRDKDRVLEALVRLKDERSAAALAGRLEKGGFDRGKISRALQQMGAVAEKPTLEVLNHTDRGVRTEACKILGEVGTKASEDALTKLGQTEKDRGVKGAADAALKKIKARAK